MENTKNHIEELIRITLKKCESWIHNGEDGLDYFVDPNDRVEISAHYGATHAAASFILWGRMTGDHTIYAKGISLLKSILKRWDKSKMLPAFHFDFNNLALTLVADLVEKELRDQIKVTVLATPDSSHDTINWLPMRWAVNCKRAQWTPSNQYDQAIDRCKKVISDATNADGGIEDRLPHGMSFNLQYNLATVAVMQFLRCYGENIDLSKELGFLLNCVAPDGDINYLGRGTNQVFAWGLWIYLLSSSCQSEALDVAVLYLAKFMPSMLEYNNIMLNVWDGEEKYLWWDYHYASVYTAHCLMWLILAYRDMDKCIIKPIKPSSSETGVHIFRSENAFVSWFEGCREYLAEKGPAIAAIWTKKQGMIFKGTFGPWQGPFGNDYIFEDVVLKNFFGLIEIKRNKDWNKNRYVHKLLPQLETEPELSLKPLFNAIKITEKDGQLKIVIESDAKSKCILNLPSITKEIDCKVTVDDKEIKFSCVETIRNQYDWVWLYQSHSSNCPSIKIIL